MKADVVVDDQGTIVLFLPQTSQATDWIELNVADDSQYFGKSLVVEHRYADDIIEGMTRDGLVLK